ncbi:MAG: YitT family protein [Bacteroidales bacterium]|nr:YitT family protein [Bacteroidales bacterium]
MNWKKVLTGVKEYALITLGILMYVIAWCIFLAPNNLVGGGVTGIASIIQYATHGKITIGYTYFTVNAVLLLLAMKTLGRSFGAKTIYAMVLASVGLNVFQSIIPQEVIQSLALENGKLISSIIGAVMVGVGIGISMSQGGSSGGTDIIALMINKKRNISPGRLMMMMDVVIILSSMLFPSYTPDGTLMPFTEKFVTIIYGYLMVGIENMSLDMYLSGTRQSVQMFVLSKKYAEIADYITTELKRGVTVLDGKGWFTKQEAQVLMIITRRSDLNLFLRAIKSIDSRAFLSVSNVMGVYGEGFDAIKGGAIKRKKKM